MSAGNAAAARRQNVGVALISSALLAAWLAWAMGWIWALAGVLGVFVHELGHALAINRAGCGPSRIMFIPFFGGLATQPRPSPDAFTGVKIALAGPAFGMLAAIPFFVVAYALNQALWLEGALFIAIINLLNLFPAPPLDGSRTIGPVLARVHPRLEQAVIVILGGVAALWALWSQNYIIAAVVALAIFGAMRKDGIRRAPIALTHSEMIKTVGLYAGTVALCLLGIAGVGWSVGIANPFVLLGDFLL
jgi:Zn-dependent protease